MNKKEATIYYLKNEDILNKDILYNYIYPNMDSNYYWSDDFSEDFYINAANAGFITVSNFYDNQLILLPEIQYEYAILDFKDLHISKKVTQLIKKQEYKFTINENLNRVLNHIEEYHSSCWLTNKYIDLIKKLNQYTHKYIDFEILCTELTCSKTNRLIAGELGYSIGSTYTSLTGFCKKNKLYNNWGTLQLVLLSQYLQKNNFSFWNLGHASMEYKIKLGAKVYSREKFLKRWLIQTKKRRVNLSNE